MSVKVHEGIIPKEELITRILADLEGRKPDISTAMLIATSAFHGDRDRSDQSYMIHLLQAFRRGTQSEDKIIVGILHDLVEDKGWTLGDLRRVGFSENSVNAVDAVTHRDEEKYFDTIVRCGLTAASFSDKKRFLAIDVKIADLSHNMDMSRQVEFPTEWNLKKLKVYIVARNYLVAIKTREIEPGTSIGDFMKMRPKLCDLELLREFSSEIGTGEAAALRPAAVP
jgi:(p)ppGpp synthase/HD superfamily hydrolase